MGRKAAVITQAEIARVIRAAIKAEAAAVEVRPDGVIIVHVAATTVPARPGQSQPRPYKDILL